MGRTCRTNGGEYRILEKDHGEDQDVGGRAILKWILREIGWDGMDWIGLIWLRIGTNGGLL
jgi:hypothetical protein